MKHRLTLAAITTALAVTAPAQAQLLNFTVTGDYSASFQFDANPTPSGFSTNNGFVLWDVGGTPFSLADIYFFNSSIGGGLEIDDFYSSSTLLVTDGPQLYSGPESAPTFLTGTFSLSQYQGAGKYILTISEASTGAVPEPASWAMMIVGFGLVGAAIRRRAQKLTINYQTA